MTHKDLNSVAAAPVISLDLCFPWNSSSSKFSDQKLKNREKNILCGLLCLPTDKCSFKMCKLKNSYQANSGMKSKHWGKRKSVSDQLVIWDHENLDCAKYEILTNLTTYLTSE